MSGANSLGGNILRVLTLAAALGLQACGGGGDDPPPPPPPPPPSVLAHPVSVAVSGLSGDDLDIRLTWSSGGSETISVNANGTAQFAQAVAVGAGFSVEITRQPGPEPELCEVTANQSATVLATGAPTPQVECHRQYRLGGVVNGLNGQGLTLVNTTTGGMDSLAVNSAGAFTFPTALDPEAAYAVSVIEHPTVPAQNCAISNGSGTMPEEDVTDIVVACIDVNAEAWRAWRVTRKADGPVEVIDETPDYPVLAPGNEGLHEFDLGKTSLDYDGTVDQKAWSTVFSTADGTQYSVNTQAPDRKSSSSVYRQIKNYRKDKEGAVLLLRVPYAMLKVYNDSLQDCESVLDLPAYSHVQTAIICTLAEAAEARLEYFARIVRIPATDGVPAEVLAGTAFEAHVMGRVENWSYGAYRSINGAHMMSFSDISDAWLSWSNDLTHDQTYRLVSLQLTNPVDIELDLSSVAVGEVFQVSIEQGAYADNSDRESYAEASFKFPGGLTGPQLHATDLTEMPVEKEVPIPSAPPPVASCPAGSEATVGGTLAFSIPSYLALEMNGRTQDVLVTRTGGSTGAVSTTVTTVAGTATASADYTPFSATVYFPDGDTTPRLVRIAILDDDEEEEDESVTLRLSPPAGCATLGTPSEATIVVIDDERQPQPTTPITYTVGGTVSGLTGTGLVISNSNLGHDQLTPSNGAFTFPTPLENGEDYRVQVESQPQSPRQICTVTNGTGTISGANVTDIAVQCEEAPLAGSLDPTFGSGGIVSGAPAGAQDMAVYPDGRFVLVNSYRQLARYLANGSPDGTFGTGGAVSLTFPSNADYYLEDVAVQSDGKIVVAGYSIELPSGKNDVLVARLNVDGTFDTTFGFGGRLTTRVTDYGARARFVLVQPDGKILVGGFAGTSIGNSDAMLLRYLPDGSLDTSFGTVGLVLRDVSGYDEAYDGALYPDGRIAIAGRAGNDGAATPDTLIARFLVNGSPDTSFAGIGAKRWDVAGTSDLAQAIAVQADGKIVIAEAGHPTSRSTDFMVIRINEDGSPDAGFGGNGDGIAHASFTGSLDSPRAVAVQDDGKIVVVGAAMVIPLIDFAILRLEQDGTPDADFGTDGRLQYDAFGTADSATCIGLQPDGRILVGGSARQGSVDVAVVVRLVP